MNNYRIVFVKNEIVSCELMLVSDVAFEGEYYYEQNHGHLLYAIMKANSPAQAIAKCDALMDEVCERVYAA